MGAPAGYCDRVRRCARDVGVELGRLARQEHELPVAEHEAQPPVEHVEPLVALVALRLPAVPGRQDDLVRLRPARTPGQRHERHVPPADRAQVHPRVPRRRRAEEPHPDEALRQVWAMERARWEALR